MKRPQDKLVKVRTGLLVRDKMVEAVDVDPLLEHLKLGGGRRDEHRTAISTKALVTEDHLNQNTE